MLGLTSNSIPSVVFLLSVLPTSWLPTVFIFVKYYRPLVHSWLCFFLFQGDQSRRCGRYRSVVRMLSSLLPLRPAPRIFFNIVKNPSNVYDVNSASNAKDKVLETTGQTLVFRKW